MMDRKLDDYCLTKIIGHAINLFKVRQTEPFVGDTGQVEKNLSLVSRRWYILTQSLIGSHGCHRIDLDELLHLQNDSPSGEKKLEKLTNNNTTIGKIPTRTNANSALATSRRLANSGILMPRNYGNISVAPSFFEPPNTARKLKKMKSKNNNNNKAINDDAKLRGKNDLKIFRAVQPKLMKYKHIQISGSLSSDQFLKLLQLMNAYKVEELDLLDVKLENDPALESNKLLQRWKREQRLKLNIHLRDQKYTDQEEKVRYLLQWSRLADLTVHIVAVQRISIDCCHIMWSAGRRLQEQTVACNIVFRVSLQTFAPTKANGGSMNRSEITVPFGNRPRYELNKSRESTSRHRDILKSIAKGCYHTFVKCVRDYNS